MKKKHIDKIRTEVGVAQRRFDEMAACADLAELASLWVQFLNAHQRVFNKMRAATMSGPSKGWFDRILNERKNDPLLCYLHQARHADEHGIEDLTEEAPPSIGLRPKPGMNTILIDRLLVQNGMISMGPAARASLDVLFRPSHVRLAAVVNKGQTYQPPAMHLGHILSDHNVLHVADLCLAYMRGFVDLAEQKFIT